MDEEEFSKITSFLDGSYSFLPNENLSNLRRKMRRYSLGSKTEFGELYYIKTKEVKKRVPTDVASKIVKEWKNGVDYNDITSIDVQHLNVIKISDVMLLVQKAHQETGCGGRNRMRYVLKKYYIKDRDRWTNEHSRCDLCDFRKAESEDLPFTPIVSSFPFILTTNRTSDNVIEMLRNLTNQIKSFGIVDFCLFQSDNGAEFKTNEMEEFIESLGANLIHGRVRHPQSQGCVERFHHTFKNQIQTLLAQNGMTLERSINQSLFIYNHSLHQTVIFFILKFKLKLIIKIIKVRNDSG